MEPATAAGVCWTIASGRSNDRLLDYGHRQSLFDTACPAFLELVRGKLAIAGEDAVNIDSERLATLRRQITPHLVPVLRKADLAGFDLDRAWEIVQKVAVSVGP